MINKIATYLNQYDKNSHFEATNNKGFIQNHGLVILNRRVVKEDI